MALRSASMFMLNFTMYTAALKTLRTRFPTKKEEAWKYTSLNAVLKNDFTVFRNKKILFSILM
jgi:hypothetical protein